MKNLLYILILLGSVSSYSQKTAIDCAGCDTSVSQCEDFEYTITTETRLADCTVSNIDTLLTIITVCNNDVITNDTIATYTEVKEDCLIDGESWKLAGSDIATTGVTGWASGHYTTDCPLWSEDVHKSATVSWDEANTLFMFGMSDDQAGTWTGDMIFYVYKWSNGTTVRNWLRAYSDTGGWLTGWLDQGATATTSDICVERSGTVETWYINGVAVATSVGNTNPLYCWSSPYTNASGTWIGTHIFTDVSMCPTKCDGTTTSIISRSESISIELTDEEASKILSSDGHDDTMIDFIITGGLESNGVTVSEPVFPTQTIQDILESLRAPNANSTIRGKFTVPELLEFSEFYHLTDTIVTEEMKEAQIVTALLQWIKEIDRA